jgi:hypothetical protein
MKVNQAVFFCNSWLDHESNLREISHENASKSELKNKIIIMATEMLEWTERLCTEKKKKKTESYTNCKPILSNLL